MSRTSTGLKFLRRFMCGLIGVQAAVGFLVAAQTLPPPMQPLKLRIVGGLAGVTQYTRHEEPFWNHELARLSAGRFTASVVPFEQSGVPGAGMLRLIQTGSVPFGTMLMSSLLIQHPEYAAPDLAALNPDMASLRKSVDAFRPYLEKSLRERRGIEVLAIYAYPAQVVFCKNPLRGLADLAGRRVRVSSPTQADFVSALGGVPILTAFAMIMDNMRSGNTECAITGTMSGNTLGLHEVTSYVHAMPINWGLSVFAVNALAWEELPTDLKALLRTELPKLETRIWTESEQETAAGLACNTGSAGCLNGRAGKMLQVNMSAQDERQRKDLFATSILPGWLRRCNNKCAEVWASTVGPAHGVMAPTSH